MNLDKYYNVHLILQIGIAKYADEWICPLSYPYLSNININPLFIYYLWRVKISIPRPFIWICIKIFFHLLWPTKYIVMSILNICLPHIHSTSALYIYSINFYKFNCKSNLFKLYNIIK